MSRAATAFADRALAEQPDDPVSRALLTAFSRPATPDERDVLSRFLDELTTQYLDEQNEAERQKAEVIKVAHGKALADLCQMLMSANEFLYVD